jgi:hypothetical protein
MVFVKVLEVGSGRDVQIEVFTSWMAKLVRKGDVFEVPLEFINCVIGVKSKCCGTEGEGGLAVDCVIKVIALFVSASGIRENLCF